MLSLDIQWVLRMGTGLFNKSTYVEKMTGFGLLEGNVLVCALRESTIKIYDCWIIKIGLTAVLRQIPIRTPGANRRKAMETAMKETVLCPP